MSRTGPDPRTPDFYDRSVHEVARDLIGCVVRHGEAGGRIVETESYHEEEPACHAFAGLTPRTRPLFGPPGRAYVYRSYGIHALLNAVAEAEEVGAAVLIRALEPVDGLAGMRSRRGVDALSELCSGPGKLTQALGVGLGLNDTSLVGGPIRIAPRGEGDTPSIVAGPRIGISKAVDLPWRFCEQGSPFVSRPRPWGRDTAPRGELSRAA